MDFVNSENSEQFQLLKAAEVAGILNVSRAFAYKLMSIGEIRTVHILGAIRVRPEDLSEYIKSNLNPPNVY